MPHRVSELIFWFSFEKFILLLQDKKDQIRAPAQNIRMVVKLFYLHKVILCKFQFSK